MSEDKVCSASVEVKLKKMHFFPPKIYSGVVLDVIFIKAGNSLSSLNAMHDIT